MLTIRRATLFACIAAVLAVPVSAQDQTSPTAAHLRYGAENEPLRLLDVYVPEGAEAPLPVILYFHGYGRSKADALYDNLPQVGEQAGAAVVAVNYTTALPNAYADAWCAVSWVQANAETYGFDPSFIIPFGVSYGGLPATMLGAQEDPSLFLDCPHPAPDPSAVQGVISLAGELPSSPGQLMSYFPDPTLWDDTIMAQLVTTPVEHWLSLDLPESNRAYLSLWPATRVDHHEPPHLLIHGARDTVLPYADTYDYARLLSRNATNVTVVLDRAARHVPGPDVYDRELVAFLERLTASRSYIPGQQRPTAYSVLYGAPDEGGRRLDVYVPEGLEPPYPVVLAFPGSGGDKADIAVFTIPDIAARAGAATVAISYATDDPLAAYADAWCALAWVQAHGAEYGLDPSRIVTFGHSYGGLPATMLGVQQDAAAAAGDCPHDAPDPESVLGVVTVAGVLLGSAEALEAFNPEAAVWQDADSAELLHSTPPEDWLALDLPADQREFLSQWPMTWINEEDPPHLLVHGGEDTIIPFENSFAYAEILTRNRVNAIVVTDHYSGHAPPPFTYDREMIVFLERAFAEPPF